MAVTRAASATGTASASVNVINGDAVLIFAYRSNSATAPSAITASTGQAVTNKGNAGANTNSYRVGIQIVSGLSSAGGTVTYSSTNATGIHVVVWRSPVALTFGNLAVSAATTGTTITFPALTLAAPSGGKSYPVALAGHRTATNVGTTPPTGTTNFTSLNNTAVHSSETAITSWTSRTVTVNASSANYGMSIELQEAAIPTGPATMVAGTYSFAGPPPGTYYGYYGQAGVGSMTPAWLGGYPVLFVLSNIDGANTGNVGVYVQGDATSYLVGKVFVIDGTEYPMTGAAFDGNYTSFTVPRGSDFVNGQSYVLDIRAPSSGGGTALTPTTVSTSAPSITQATIGQANALSPTAVKTAAPAISAATLNQANALTPSPLETSAPVLSSATITQATALTSGAISTAPPAVASAGLAQNHSLSTIALSTPAPSISSASIAQTHALSANAVVGGPPSLSSPTINQTAMLNAAPVVTSAPVIAPSAISQQTALNAVALATSAPVLGSASLAQAHALSSLPVTTAPPSIAASELRSVHALTSTAVTTFAPLIAPASLATMLMLEAANLSTAPPSIAPASLSQSHVLTSSPVSTFPVVISSASIAQSSGLVSVAVVGMPPAIASASMAPGNAIALLPVTTAPVVISSSSMAVRHALASAGVATLPPVIVAATLTYQAGLTAPAITGAPPAIGLATIAQSFSLSAVEVSTSPPAISLSTITALAPTDLIVSAAFDLFAEPRQFVGDAAGRRFDASVESRIFARDADARIFSLDCQTRQFVGRSERDRSMVDYPYVRQAERRNFRMNFPRTLAEGDTLTQIISVMVTEGACSITNQQISDDKKSVKFKVSEAQKGRTQINVLAETADGERVEDIAVFQVR